jgi:hypothetical protein
MVPINRRECFARRNSMQGGGRPMLRYPYRDPSHQFGNPTPNFPLSTCWTPNSIPIMLERSLFVRFFERIEPCIAFTVFSFWRPLAP